MIQIQKNETPDFLSTFITENPTATYDNDSFKPYRQMLRDMLIREQKGICAYCCSRITDENSHNEHIEPRHMKDGRKSKRSLDYKNIVASCNSNHSCGRYKSNDYDEKRFISPIDRDCENIFSYEPDGFIKGDEYTIFLLNLNSYELRRARRSIYREIMNMSNDDIRLCFCSDSEQYWPFIDVIFWYLKENEYKAAEEK